MKLFKKDLAAKPIQPPTVAHYHDHGQSETGPLLTKAFITIAGLILAWYIALYLLAEAGSPHPERTLAQFLIWAIIILGLLFLLQHWFARALERKYEHEEAMAEQRTQQIRYQQLLTGSAIADSRTTGDRQRLATLIYMIMLDAYDHVAKSGPYRGSWRPWSRRPAGERVLVTLGETAPVGQEFGARVRPFLETQGVITNDQINLDQYPSIADVQRLLHQPVLLQAGPPTPPENGGDNWSIIE